MSTALLAAGGALGVLHGIRRADSAALRRAVPAGGISILMGQLVIRDGADSWLVGLAVALRLVGMA